MTPRLEDALRKGIAALDELRLRYTVVGGLAVSVWGVPRATRDVDLYAELPLDARSRLRAELTIRGFDVPAMEEELQRFGVFRSKLRNKQVFLDIFDATGPLGDSILERRKRVPTRYGDVWAVPEQPLDSAYIERWARLLDESIGGDEVSERLANARRLAERQRPS